MSTVFRCPCQCLAWLASWRCDRRPNFEIDAGCDVHCNFSTSVSSGTCNWIPSCSAAVYFMNWSNSHKSVPSNLFQAKLMYFDITFLDIITLHFVRFTSLTWTETFTSVGADWESLGRASTLPSPNSVATMPKKINRHRSTPMTEIVITFTLGHASNVGISARACIFTLQPGTSAKFFVYKVSLNTYQGHALMSAMV